MTLAVLARAKAVVVWLAKDVCGEETCPAFCSGGRFPAASVICRSPTMPQLPTALQGLSGKLKKRVRVYTVLGERLVSPHFTCFAD